MGVLRFFTRAGICSRHFSLEKCLFCNVKRFHTNEQVVPKITKLIFDLYKIHNLQWD